MRTYTKPLILRPAWPGAPAKAAPALSLIHIFILASHTQNLPEHVNLSNLPLVTIDRTLAD